ncbi:MAG: class I mannose-6-phosphate isomerase [Acidobacteriaceae bacterium]|nr:class I mannose-6-phosphate isomerase [Acidobacteriaceae bacterium]
MSSQIPTSGGKRPFRLLPIFRDRIWGRTSLAPFFPGTLRKNPVGEVWFTFNDNETSEGGHLGEVLAARPDILGSAADSRHPGICPLLVKLLFTTKRLSVQVHPDDEYARQRHNSLGKTEAWYVIDSQAPGEIAVGFREKLTPERLRSAANSGEIESLLEWRKVKAGDVVFVPAGTVHAIGAGLIICEIQENSDVTYRLYDYGRDRELHLDDGVQVSSLGPHQYSAQAVALTQGREELAVSEYFRIERLRPSRSMHIGAGTPYYLLLICVAGTGMMDAQAVEAGQCWMVPADNSEIVIDAPGSTWIATYTAPEPLGGLRVD